jgi:hypothetical protein
MCPHWAGDNGPAYEYVPGAGDDEESWGKGLTPALMWQHREVRDTGVTPGLQVLHGRG